MTNKTLRYLYQKLYNNGDFLELIVKIKDIKKINQYYKTHFDKYDNIADFFESMGYMGELLKKSKAATCEVEKQFKIKKGLQPAILSECFIVQSIANFLSLEYFIDVDNSQEKIPLALAMHVMHYSGETGITLPRYIYHNQESNIVLLQYGDSSSIDAIFLKDKISVRIEFKEEKSKLTELDINSYDENGHLFINDKFKKEYEDYVTLIEEFNNQTTVFKHIGRNFKIENYLGLEKVTTILNKNFKTKNIDLFLLQQKNHIFPILPEDLLQNINISGSEIRTAGRNPAKVFTPIYAQKILQEKGGVINNNGFVKLPFEKNSLVTGRNLSKITRYKINNLLFMKIKDIEIENDVISFNIKDLKQLKPTVSIHINAMASKKSLYKLNIFKG